MQGQGRLTAREVVMCFSQRRNADRPAAARVCLETTANQDLRQRSKWSAGFRVRKPHPYPKRLCIHACIHATAQPAKKTQQPRDFQRPHRFRPEAPPACIARLLKVPQSTVFSALSGIERLRPCPDDPHNTANHRIFWQSITHDYAACTPDLPLFGQLERQPPSGWRQSAGERLTAPVRLSIAR